MENLEQKTDNESTVKAAIICVTLYGLVTLGLNLIPKPEYLYDYNLNYVKQMMKVTKTSNLPESKYQMQELVKKYDEIIDKRNMKLFRENAMYHGG